MLDLLALLTNKLSWRLYSRLIRLLLRLRGIRLGTNLYVEGTPRLKMHGKAKNITIGNNVRILGDIDLRNREDGAIVFHDNVMIEGGCRFVSARQGTIEIGKNTVVTTGAIINGGGDVIVGPNCIIGPRSSMNANEHLFKRDTLIRKQGFLHADIIIEEDCWLGANVVIMKGTNISRGSVVGASSVVTKSTTPYSINVGIPARQIGERSLNESSPKNTESL